MTISRLVHKGLIIAGAGCIGAFAFNALEPCKISLAAASTTTATVVNLDLPVTGSPQSEHKMYTKQLANGHYEVSVAAKAGSAARPGSNIIVRSSGNQVRVDDVERRDFSQQTATPTLQVRDGRVSVYVQLGQDQLFSSGREVSLRPVSTPRAAPPSQPAANVTSGAGANSDTPKPAAQPVTRPAELPRTGPAGAGWLAVAAAITAGYLLHSHRRRRTIAATNH